MGQRIVAVSDLSGSEEDVQPVVLLGADGTKLTVDLSVHERNDLEDALKPYRDAAQPARGRRPSGAPRSKPASKGRERGRQAKPTDVEKPTPMSGEEPTGSIGPSDTPLG